MKQTFSQTTDSVVDTGHTILDWVSNNLDALFQVIILIAIAIVITRLISEILIRLLRKTIREDMYPTKTDRDRRLHTLNSISTAIITFLVWMIALIMILNTLGVNTAPILASAGILSVALGFGAQSLVKDFMTGMFIIAENQYRVGDYVEIQNVRGTVKAVTMRTTVIIDDDGSVFHIPNGSIVVTGNHTMSNNKVSIEISASTETDIVLLQEVINKTGIKQSKSETMKDLIVEPLQFKRIKEITGGSVKVRILGKVKPGKQNEVKSDYFALLQKELVKNKIALK